MLLWISALVPYVIFSLLTGTFHRNAFYLLAGLTAALSFWFVILPRRLTYDAGFLIVAAAPQVTHVFGRLYVPPNSSHPLPMEILGHLSWIHVGVLALLVLRAWDPGEFSFWPTVREWRLGFVAFLIGIAPLIVLAEGVHDIRLDWPHATWWKLALRAIGTFFGILWVVALSEELIFRGVIQRAIQNRWCNPIIAISLAAALFGTVHLWLHGFPNWRHASVATLLGVICGFAYWRAGSVRASMVTHACAVVTWRLFSG